jgi:hypothetical protein
MPRHFIQSTRRAPRPGATTVAAATVQFRDTQEGQWIRLRAVYRSLYVSLVAIHGTDEFDVPLIFVSSTFRIPVVFVKICIDQSKHLTRTWGKYGVQLLYSVFAADIEQFVHGQQQSSLYTQFTATAAVSLIVKHIHKRTSRTVRQHTT